MGFNKRSIDKNMILDNIYNIQYITKLTKADGLIMDQWSKNFFDNLNFNIDYYSVHRELIESDTIFDSSLNSIHNHPDLDKLKSLSNILINLNNSPSWIDVVLTFEILGSSDMDKEIRGRFQPMVEYCISKIIDYYSTS